MSDIKRSDIAEADLFGDIGKSAEKATGEVKLLETQLEMLAAQAKKLKNNVPTDTPDSAPKIKKENELIKDANLLINTKIKLDNQLIKAQAKLDATTKDYREELAKVRVENAKANKEAKNTVILQDKSASAYQKAGIRLADLKRQLKDAAIAGNKTEEEIKELTDEFQKLDKEVRDADQSVGDFSRNVGNYSSAFDGFGEGVGEIGENLGGAISGAGGFGSSIQGVIGKLGPWGAAAGAAIGGAVALGDAISDVDKEFDQLRGTIAQLTGLEGAALDSLTASIKAFETTFGAETNESLRAANVLIKEFGLSGEEAAGLIEQGFLSNANIQGDLLEGITEYSTQIKAAGGDADDLFKILDASGTAGVFSDKGIDTVKEFGLRIREQTNTTSDALRAGFGDAFTDELFGGINDGSITTVEALQTVTNALEDTELSARDRQTIIADVFGGAGEDAGSFLETLTEINFETAFNADLSGELAQRKQKELEANEALAAAQNELSKSIEGNAALSRLWTNIQTELITGFIGIINWIGNLVDSFEKLKTDPVRALSEIGKAITDLLLFPINRAIYLSNQLIGLFADFEIPFLEFPLDEINDFNAAQRESNRIVKLSQKAIEKYKDAVTQYIGKEQQRVNLLTDGNTSQEQRNDLIKGLTEDYPELIKNYDLENLSQEDAIRLNKELQVEITNTAILKQKALALGIVESRRLQEQAKIDLITNKSVREQKEKELNFEVERQLYRIDLIEEETRIKLGLKEREIDEINDLNEDGVDDAADGYKTDLDNFRAASEAKIDQAEKEEQRIFDLRTQREQDIKDNDKENQKTRDQNDKNEQDRIKKANAEQEKEEERRRKKQEDFDKQEAEDLKELYEDRGEIIEAFTDKAIENLDKRLDGFNDEIDAAQKQADYFAELAANGNINAEQSLAEQNEIIAEAEAEKAKIEKQKQAIQLISSVVLAYNNELGEGKTTQEALKEALTGTTTISAFIAALPTFFDGTENTGTHGNGIDGRGGFNAILHPNERVLTKKQNDMIGDISNDNLAEIMQNYRLGNLDIGANVMSATMNTEKLESKLDSVTDAINNKPEIDIIKLTSTAMMIKEAQKRGNFKTTNRFKVN